jgi:P4 family phage/plasmid primase-like protien
MSATPLTLDGLLEKYKYKEGNEITHTKIGSPKLGIYGGKYSIPNEELPLFWKLYHKEVFLRNKDCYLVEAQIKKAGPILIDIDERYSSDITERQHTDEHIFDLMELYIENVKKYIEWDQHTFVEPPKVFILEKPHANTLNDEYTKDGIHIVINLKIPFGLQMAIRNNVVKDLPNIFEDLPLTNDYESLLDSRISSGVNKWQIFGSKKPENEAYKLKKIYNVIIDSEDMVNFEERDFNSKDMLKILPEVSARNFDTLDTVLTDEAIDIAKKWDQTKKKRKARIISKTDKNKSPIFTISSFSTIDTPEKCEEAIQHILEIAKNNDDHDIIMAHDMVKLLDVRYYDPYDRWMEVGWALKTVSELLYPVWLGFSSRSEKFNWETNDCYHIWQEHGGNGSLTLGSICYWARECDPDAYKTIKESSIEHYLNKTINGETEYDVARLVYAIYEGQFKCTNIRNKIWYQFKNGRWEEIDSGTTLRHNLSKNIHQLYANKMQTLIDSLNNMDADSEMAKDTRGKIKQLGDMAIKLKKTSWKQNIMRECCECFFDGEFLNMLDKNTELLCFKNGVLDIKNKCFRESRPNDYLSLCTNSDYVEFNEDDPEHVEIRDEIMEFMRQLFPEEGLNNYMWEHLASVLVGDNRNQTFNIYTGCGRNGKSKLVELMDLVLGDYKGSVPLALITQSRGSIGGVSPEIAQLKGIRYAVMQEPSKATKLNEGIMKELTGGDPIQGRALFKDTVTFVPQFSLVVCTNHLFDINSSDDGTWRRIRVCDFQSKFVDNPSTDPKDYQFKVDRSIDKKFKRWAPIFTSLLVQKLFETNGMVKDCSAVLAPTQNYKAQQDHFAGFVKERIVKMDGAKIKKRDVLNEFQEWYTELYGGKVPSGRELYEFLTKQLGEPSPLGWKGYKLYHAHDLVDDMDIQPNGL